MVVSTEKLRRERETKIVVGTTRFKETGVDEAKTEMIRKVKSFIFREVYPMRPIPYPVMDFGALGDGDYEVFVLIKAITNGEGDHFEKERLFDCTNKTLEEVGNLCDYIPELVEMAR